MHRPQKLTPGVFSDIESELEVGNKGVQPPEAKTRKNTKAGLKVTLRKDKMYEFIDRLVNIALPRIKDFRGLSSKGFDNFGNYTFGIKEHIIFPEVNFDKVDKIRGLDITIVISAIDKKHSYELLKRLNFPFKEERAN